MLPAMPPAMTSANTRAIPQSLPPDDSFERAAWARGFRLVAGVDEVGRGPLAGPVVAAAVVLDPDAIPSGLADSKRLSPARRVALASEIHRRAAVGVGLADVAEIDALNILEASMLAMSRALAALPVAPDLALIDGNRCPRGLACPAEAVVRGDARAVSIAAASIVAKVARDAMMADLDRAFPGYGWAINAGYPTPAHLGALTRLGVTPHHRRSFAPVHKMLCEESASTR
jgi:ribonuclease HII